MLMSRVPVVHPQIALSLVVAEVNPGAQQEKCRI